MSKYAVVYFENRIADATGEKRANAIAARARIRRWWRQRDRREWRNRHKGTPAEQRQRRYRLASYGIRVLDAKTP